MPTLSVRVDFEPGGRLGPGKVTLLEEIEAHGSISGAARAMPMSYKRAWDLVEDMNRVFGNPVVATKPGGRSGGGAELTETGRLLIKRYRAIERAALAAAETEMRALAEAIAQDASRPDTSSRR